MLEQHLRWYFHANKQKQQGAQWWCHCGKFCRGFNLKSSPYVFGVVRKWTHNEGPGWVKGSLIVILFISIGTMLAPTLAFWGSNALLLWVDITGTPSFITRYRIQLDKNNPVSSRFVLDFVLSALTLVLFFYAVDIKCTSFIFCILWSHHIFF